MRRTAQHGTTKTILLSTIAVLLAFTTAPPALSEPSKPVCEIIAVKHTAWAMKTHDTVMTTLEAGDTLSEGDILEVKRGNVVQIAFDGQQKNILYVEGPTTMQITSLGITELELKQGKIFALLDDLGKGQTFEVRTPTAIASVRGTQYKLQATGLTTDLAVYKGMVRARSRMADGSASSDFVDVGVGQKLNLDGFNEKPQTPANMTLDEAAEISEIQWETRETKSQLNQDGFKSQIDVQSEWDLSSKDKHSDKDGNAVIY